MKKLSYVLAILTALAIVWLTLTPQETSLIAGSDKLHHFLAFVALCFPMAFVNPKAVFWIFGGAVLFGGGIEIIQPYVNRRGEWADFAADSIGAAMGIGAGLFAKKLTKSKKHDRP